MLFKIINREIFFPVSFSFLSTLFPAILVCQELKVIKNVAEYRQQVQDDSLMEMVELKSVVPGIVYDLRYAGNNNFTGEKLYKQSEETFLRRSAATALKNVQAELNKKGFGLKIFDAYRPYSITVKLWEMIPDERYTANPSRGSNHNRGLAVDLTIIERSTGKELNMGTGFDNFTDSAYHNFKHLPKEIFENRQLLRNVMEKHGFHALESEWWHYSWPNDRKYDVLDIEFKKLKK